MNEEAPSHAAIGGWVFVLTAADGRPLLIAESPEALAEEAAGCDIDTVSVH